MRSEKRSGKSYISIILAILVLLNVCSLAVLMSQLTGFSESRQRNYISLTEGTAESKVSVKHLRTNGVHYAPMTLAAHNPYEAVTLDADNKTGFSASDKNTVWSTETDVEIFKIHYDDNGDGHYTVNSERGDNVFAPGTGNDYSFTLKNTGSKSLDYKLWFEAYYKGTNGLMIPVVVRLTNDDGYMIGSDTKWEQPEVLNSTSEAGVIAAGKIKDYTLQWQWPFERGTGDALKTNDTYDTMLGNKAVNEDLELHIVIHTRAELDENESAPGGKSEGVKTGDPNNPTIWIVTEVVTLTAILFLLIERKKLKDAEKEGSR